MGANEPDPNSRNQLETVVRTQRLTFQGARSLLVFLIALLPSDLLAGDLSHPFLLSGISVQGGRSTFRNSDPSPRPPLGAVQGLGPIPHMPRLVREGGREAGWNLNVTRAWAGGAVLRATLRTPRIPEKREPGQRSGKKARQEHRKKNRMGRGKERERGNSWAQS